MILILPAAALAGAALVSPFQRGRGPWSRVRGV